MLKQPLAPIFDFLPQQAQPIPKVMESKPVAAPPLQKFEDTPTASLKPETMQGSLPPLGVSIRKKTTVVAESAVQGEKTHTSNDENVAVSDQNYITESTLLKVWNTFANIQDTFTKQTLANSNPKLTDNSVIKITLENSFKEEKVKEVQSELMQYLRAQLKNPNLLLQIDVTELAVEKRAYTDREKLAVMLKENPALVKLIEVLGLEME